MRKIDPKSHPIPRQINYSQIRDHLKLIITDEATKAKGKIYRGTSINSDGKKENFTITALKEKYKNKCGYCERKEHRPCVEHHRPIGDCSGADNGYYWLSYEWTNMVASCKSCNERPYKGTQFPILSNRKLHVPKLNGSDELDFNSFRYNSNYLMSEKPLIIHPEYIDDPNEHFKFTRKGKIKGISDRGKESVKVYGLNDDNLIAWRKNIFREYNDRIKRALRKHLRASNPISKEHFKEELKDVIYDLTERIHNPDEHEYTLFASQLLQRFEHFFIRPQDSIVHDLLKDTYTDIIQEKINANN